MDPIIIPTQFRDHLLNVCQLDFTRIVLVGVSGGPDSLCLLHLLHRAGCRIVVAHLNHQLRPEADDEMAHVAQLAEAFSLPLVTQTINIRALAVEQGMSIEEAARAARYRFLFGQADLTQAQAVLAGHTADDQAETVLMHVLRGSGLSGLKGMPARWLPNAWSERVALVRPLLAFWRSATLQYCQEHQLPYLLDSSNNDTTYRRNRVRHEVIPYLEQFNPALRPALVRMASVLQSDHAIVEQATQAAWRRCVAVQQPKAVAFHLDILRSQPVEVQGQILRHALGLSRPGLSDLDYQSVQRALSCLAQPPATGQCDLVAGMRMLFEPGIVWVAGWEVELPNADWPQLQHAYSLALPGEITLPGRWVLQAAELSFTEHTSLQASKNPDPFQAFLDLERIQLPMEIRTRQPGERFQPLGLADGTLKLSDYFINRKLPRRARARWPLVCSDQLVAWVPGFILAHPYRITSETRRIAWLRLFRS